MGISVIEYVPSDDDMVSRTKPVAGMVAVTFVPGSSFPAASVTVPVRLLRSTCATAGTELARDRIVEAMSATGEK
jgi:hypothetical protein